MDDRYTQLLRWHFSASDQLRSLPLTLASMLGICGGVWLARGFESWLLPGTVIILLSPACAIAGRQAQCAFQFVDPTERSGGKVRFALWFTGLAASTLSIITLLTTNLWQRDIRIQNLLLPESWSKLLLVLLALLLAHSVLSIALLHAGHRSLTRSHRQPLGWSVHLSALVGGAGIMISSLVVGTLIACLVGLSTVWLFGKTPWALVPLLMVIGFSLINGILGLARLGATLSAGTTPHTERLDTRAIEENQRLARAVVEGLDTNSAVRASAEGIGRDDFTEAVRLAQTFQGLRSRGLEAPEATLSEALRLRDQHPTHAGLLLELALLYQLNTDAALAAETAAAAITQATHSGAFPVAAETLTAFASVRDTLPLEETIFAQLAPIMRHQGQEELAAWCASRLAVHATTST